MSLALIYSFVGSIPGDQLLADKNRQARLPSFEINVHQVHGNINIYCSTSSGIIRFLNRNFSAICPGKIPIKMNFWIARNNLLGPLDLELISFYPTNMGLEPRLKVTPIFWRWPQRSCIIEDTLHMSVLQTLPLIRSLKTQVFLRTLPSLLWHSSVSVSVYDQDLVFGISVF